MAHDIDLAGAPVSWGQRVLAKRLPEFLHLHPAIEIQLELSDHFVDLARERMLLSRNRVLLDFLRGAS